MYKKGIPKIAIAFKRACFKKTQKISILLSLICIDDNIMMNKNKTKIYNRETIPFIRNSPLAEIPPLYHDWLRYLN